MVGGVFWFWCLLPVGGKGADKRAGRERVFDEGRRMVLGVDGSCISARVLEEDGLAAGV